MKTLLLVVFVCIGQLVFSQREPEEKFYLSNELAHNSFIDYKLMMGIHFEVEMLEDNFIAKVKAGGYTTLTNQALLLDFSGGRRFNINRNIHSDLCLGFGFLGLLPMDNSVVGLSLQSNTEVLPGLSLRAKGIVNLNRYKDTYVPAEENRHSGYVITQENKWLGLEISLNYRIYVNGQK